MINIDYGDLIAPKEIDEGIRKLILDIIHKSNFNYKEEEYKIKVSNDEESWVRVNIEIGERCWYRTNEYPDFYVNGHKYYYEGSFFNENEPYFASLDLMYLYVRHDKVISTTDDGYYFSDQFIIDENNKCNEVKSNI